MVSVCESCKALEKYKYWHEAPRNFQFFKIMLCDFENQLRIPRKFVKCFREDLSSLCVLRGKSGNVWDVSLIKTEEDVIFSNGWEKFARDHNLKYGYMLLFSYVGDSSFDVSVFDQTGCENEGSHFTKNMNNVSSETPCNSLFHSKNSEDSGVTDCTAADNGNQIVNEMSESIDRKKRVASQGKQSKLQYLSKRRKVTEEQKQDADYTASLHVISRSKSKTGGHRFKVKMLPTHVSIDFHLTIPKNWAVKHMLLQPHDVILQVPGIEWSWRVGCRWTQSQCQIRSGWSKFVLDNNIEEHDVCVFELQKKGKLGNPAFDVHIYRVIKEVVPLTVLRS